MHAGQRLPDAGRLLRAGSLTSTTLTEHALAKLSRIEGIHILGQAQDRGGVVAFELGEIHPHDVATVLARTDYQAVAEGFGAAGLLVKLKHLDDWSAKRRANAARYDALLAEKGIA